MSIEPIVHPDGNTLAAAVAARLVTSILDAQAARGAAQVVLTGGTIGTASMAAVRAEPAHPAVDWQRVDFWWSDERFEPEGSDLRNATGARDALLAHLPVDPARVHEMPPRGGRYGDDIAAAAAGYADELAAAAPPRATGPYPSFDVAMLGVGHDGHVASLFPGFTPAAPGVTVVPVLDSPKPPPTRISFTLPVINSAREVWLIADGAVKAPAIAAALGVSGDPVPAGRVQGTHRTLALIDTAAASLL